MPAMRKDRQPGDSSLWTGEEFARRRNWVDLGRGLAGGFAVVTTIPVLVEFWIGVAHSKNINLELGLEMGVFLAAITIQMIRIEERLTFFPPVFFICGLAFAVVGWKIALLAFVAIWAINVAIPNPGVFLAAYGSTVLIMGVLLQRGLYASVMMGVLAVYPPVVAVLFRRRMASFRKRTKVVVR